MQTCEKHTDAAAEKISYKLFAMTVDKSSRCAESTRKKICNVVGMEKK